MPTVLITGANRGLGLEFAKQYAKAGWHVIGTSRSLERADALRALGPTVMVHPLDVADFGAVTALGRKLEDETIDILIANAGVSLAREMSPRAIEAEAWADTLRVNVMAPLALAAAFYPQVARSGERKMIAISSRLGSMGANSEGGLYVYRSSKAALNAVWRSYALDHPDIIAALVHPGWVRTDMGGAGGFLDAEESISGLRRVIAGLGKADSGRFYNYDGNPIPW